MTQIGHVSCTTEDRPATEEDDCDEDSSVTEEKRLKIHQRLPISAADLR
jgi:hypothetical protein